MLVGFRLAGIDGELVRVEDAMERIKALYKDKTVGALIITRSILQSYEEEILTIKMKSKQMMITAVPVVGEPFENDLAKYIKDSIGLKL